MADIAEQICLAVDQIVAERLKSVNYDTTITATIIDNKDAKNYTYVCSNGSAQFIAYSKDTTFEINDSVQVTIPNSDYEQQKVIIGRTVKKGDVPYVFAKPFSTIIDVSSNLIQTGDGISSSLRANDDYDKVPFIPGTNKYQEAIMQNRLWSKIFEEGYTGFTRLGLQGQFRSWISALKPKSGNYGYKLEVLSTHGETIENNALITEWAKVYVNILNRVEYLDSEVQDLIGKTPDSWFTRVQTELNLSFSEGTIRAAFISTLQNTEQYSSQRLALVYAMIHSNAQITELLLDSTDMYGDPFNFQGFFEQEKVFDISSLGTIFGMSLFFYEISGTFYNKDEEYLPYTKPNSTAKLTPNLFTKDPYVCLAYDLASFDSEQAILTTLDGTTYISKDNIPEELNRKTVRLRWLHQYDDGRINVINDDTKLDGYEVRWYRFKMGAPSADEYSGVYWESVMSDENSVFSYTFLPGVNVATEQVKAIILFNGDIIRSNIITFTSEVDVASPATAEVLAGLSVWCADGSYGNYCLYGQNNDLLNPSKANEILTAEAHFTDQSLLAKEYDIDKMSTKLQEAKEIIWEFPLNNTMIVVQGFNYSYDKKVPEDATGTRYKLDGYFTDAIVQVRGNSIFITRTGAADNAINACQDYRIGKTYSTTKINNTIKCSIKKNGLVYSAAKDLTFGIMGTNGTDATVVIDFNNNKTALTADKENEALKVTAHLYDSTHTEVDFNNLDLEINCEWSWFVYKEFTKSEEESIKDAALNEYLINHPDIAGDLTEASKEEIKKQGLINASTVKIDTSSEEEPSNVCFITHESTLDIASKNFFLILQAKITGFGDYDLIAYKAIPIRKNVAYRYAIGPTEIIYSSNGYANYFKEPYQLYWCESPDNVNEYDMVIDETKLAASSNRWYIYDPFAENTNETNSRFIGQVSEANILRPASIYVAGANPYGVACYENVEGELNKENICWIQPLVIIQNQYPSATLNHWNGKDIEIDHENGSIVSPAIAAGKKNSDNTFSGVMIGDWSNVKTKDEFGNPLGGTADDITKQTGVYGFNHGAMSFSFTDDGTAFIGKSGRGRIEFNGNTGILKSANWTDIKKSGMHLDLDDGILKLQKDPGYDQIQLTSETYAANTYYLLNSQYIQVPHNTKFGENFNYSGGEFDCSSDTVYFKTSIIRHGKIDTEVEFNQLKSTLYIQARALYIPCKKEEKWAYEIIYYEPTFTKADNVTAAMFNENKQQRYYTLVTHNLGDNYNTYKLAGSTFSDKTTYYTKDYIATKTCAEEFKSNTNKNFYVRKEDQTLGIYYELAPSNFSDFVNGQLYEVAMIRSYLNKEEQYVVDPEFYFTKGNPTYEKYNSAYRRDLEYYKTGYLSQDYSYQLPDANIWNQFEDGKSKDPNLADNEYYYTNIETFTLATGEFDPNAVYYKDNKENASAARYITLSAAAERFPLAIGNDSNESSRRFKVEWDGTCHIENGIFRGEITADKGYLYDLEIMGRLDMNPYSGCISANKTDLYDFDSPGFYLDSSGLNIGDDSNYFLATTTFTGFYNGTGGTKVTGTGIDIFAGLKADTAATTMAQAEGIIHMGWSDNEKYSTPYVRFGGGTGAFGGQRNAGIVKKFTHGIWIGSYGDNNSQYTPAHDSWDQMAGIFVDLNDLEVYRYDKGKYVQARYAVFAPDDVTIKDSSTTDPGPKEDDTEEEET